MGLQAKMTCKNLNVKNGNVYSATITLTNTETIIIAPSMAFMTTFFMKHTQKGV